MPFVSHPFVSALGWVIHTQETMYACLVDAVGAGLAGVWWTRTQVCCVAPKVLDGYRG